MEKQHSQHLPQLPYSSPNSLPLWKKKRAQAQRGPLMYKAQQGDPCCIKKTSPCLLPPHHTPCCQQLVLMHNLSRHTVWTPHSLKCHYFKYSALVYSCRVSFEFYTIILSRTWVWNKANREVVDIFEMETTFPNLTNVLFYLILFQSSELLLLSLWN